MEEKRHQTETPRESLHKSEAPILRDIGNQLSMLEQRAPLPWQQFYKSFLVSQSVSVEKIVKQLHRNGESDKLETMYDILIDATNADYSANNNFEVSASELVDEILKLAA